MAPEPVREDPASAGSSLFDSDTNVGLCYSPRFLEHETGSRHPESVERLRAIVRALESSGISDRLQGWEPEPVDREILGLVHPLEHQLRVKRACEDGPSNLDPDTTVSVGSWDAALRAAGGLVEAVQRVSTGQHQRAFCLGRPPGHHALPTRSMGFCLFNNVAVGALSAIHAGLAERVAIVDIDVHHGNGTQSIFYDDARVLYCSTHQYPFYPGTGALNEIGIGDGAGSTINVPFPSGVGDSTYKYALDDVLLPSIDRFAPDLILVSLGFDAHWRDPLANIRLSLDGYRHMIEGLLAKAGDVCEGKIVFALEGGYDLDVLAEGASMLCRTLLDGAVQSDALGNAPGVAEPPIGKELVSAAARLHGLG